MSQYNKLAPVGQKNVGNRQYTPTRSDIDFCNSESPAFVKRGNGFFSSFSYLIFTKVFFANNIGKRTAARLGETSNDKEIKTAPQQKNNYSMVNMSTLQMLKMKVLLNKKLFYLSLLYFCFFFAAANSLKIVNSGKTEYDTTHDGDSFMDTEIPNVVNHKRFAHPSSFLFSRNPVALTSLIEEKIGSGGVPVPAMGQEDDTLNNESGQLFDENKEREETKLQSEPNANSGEKQQNIEAVPDLTVDAGDDNAESKTKEASDRKAEKKDEQQEMLKQKSKEQAAESNYLVSVLSRIADIEKSSEQSKVTYGIRDIMPVTEGLKLAGEALHVNAAAAAAREQQAKEDEQTERINQKGKRGSLPTIDNDLNREQEQGEKSSRSPQEQKELEAPDETAETETNELQGPPSQASTAGDEEDARLPTP